MNAIHNFFECIIILAKLVLRGRFINYNGIKNLNIKTPECLCILGNGISLKNETFEGFGEANFMVVNRHVLSDDYLIKKPRFYVMSDPHFFRYAEGLSILKMIKEVTTWELYFFVPFTREAKSVITKHISDTPSNIHYVFFNVMEVNTGVKYFDKWIYMHNLAMPRVNNVLVAAIIIATFLGYKEINIYGAEHSWTKYLFVNDNNEACLYNPHFYDRGDIEIKTVTEIQHRKMTIGDALHMYAFMFDSYHIVKEIAQWNNVAVINRTPNSFIDAFDRQ